MKLYGNFGDDFLVLDQESLAEFSHCFAAHLTAELEDRLGSDFLCDDEPA